jgi:hypothetical protein
MSWHKSGKGQHKPPPVQGVYPETGTSVCRGPRYTQDAAHPRPGMSAGSSRPVQLLIWSGPDRASGDAAGRNRPENHASTLNIIDAPQRTCKFCAALANCRLWRRLSTQTTTISNPNLDYSVTRGGSCRRRQRSSKLLRQARCDIALKRLQIRALYSNASVHMACQPDVQGTRFPILGFRFGPQLAVNLARAGQKPVPNGPGLRPGVWDRFLAPPGWLHGQNRSKPDFQN